MNNVDLIRHLEEIVNPIHLLAHDGTFLYSSSKRKENNPFLTNETLRTGLMQKLFTDDTPLLLSKTQNTAGLLFANGDYLLVGPISFDSKISPQTRNEKIKAVNALLQTYFFISRSTAEDNVPIDDESLKDFFNNMESSKQNSLNLYQVLPTDTPHNAYSYEIKHLEAVSEGNPEKALRALRAPMHGKEGRMGFTPLRHAKNSAIINATLDARAAIRGGVRVETAYTLADFFILTAELCKTEAEAIKVREECTYRFALLVKEQKHKDTQNYSLIVNKLLEEIERSIFVKVTRKDLVDSLERNEDYVERLFKKDIGHSIMEHLRIKRINTAKEILATSNIKISDLAALLHFSSTSHLARVFKLYTNVSPIEYREKIHKKILLT